MSKEKITENTTLEKILRYPGTSSVLVKHGIYCPTCPYARFEMAMLKIGDVARSYGANLDVLLKELNEAVEKGQ
ncbi:disulfide oxidoreductase [Candidatus Bathyarchaeota archaeon]|nr:MAG: disulfide oxidoreductase [Candidatus Bathyarchaeota archaeon]